MIILRVAGHNQTGPEQIIPHAHPEMPHFFAAPIPPTMIMLLSLFFQAYKEGAFITADSMLSTDAHHNMRLIFAPPSLVLTDGCECLIVTKVMISVMPVFDGGGGSKKDPRLGSINCALVTSLIL